MGYSQTREGGGLVGAREKSWQEGVQSWSEYGKNSVHLLPGKGTGRGDGTEGGTAIGTSMALMVVVRVVREMREDNRPGHGKEANK